MAQSPNKLNFMRQRKFIPVTQFSGLDAYMTVTKGAVGGTLEVGLSSDAASGTLNNNTISATLVMKNPIALGTAGLGSALLTEWGASGGIMGLLMVSATDRIQHFMMIPTEWDRDHPLYARIIWGSKAAAVGARDITWTFGGEWQTMGSGTYAAEGELTVMNTYDAQAPAGVANTFERSAISSNLWVLPAANPVVDADLYWVFAIAMSAFDGAFTESKYLLGIEFEYSPRYGIGHCDKEAPAWRPPGGTG